MKKVAFVFLLFVCSVFQVSAAIYMKYPNIDGEVTTAGHEKEIELGSCNFGIARNVTTPAGGTTREASAPTLSEISVTKLMDVSSTKLMKESVVGSGAGDVVISLTTTVKDAVVTYCKITLSNVLVSSYSVSTGGDRPSESLTLNFTKIMVEYFPQNGAQTPPSFGWDIATQKPL